MLCLFIPASTRHSIGIECWLLTIRRAQRQIQAQEASTSQPESTPALSLVEIEAPPSQRQVAVNLPAQTPAQRPVTSPSSQQNSLGPDRPTVHRRMNRREYCHSIYGEMFRMARKLQGTYQYLDQSCQEQRASQRNQN